ncbi:glyoxalase [Psychroflexus aestuariivivens]|uniref:glyoxalase n=1 Tax=Psychroflexus aestuariivivens TaxID=1795040 RepID=UPI000FD8F232|nr:glyoxalase [Psychroflexus aestuariivivens]
MNARDEQLKSIRPEIPNAEIKSRTAEMERFQNLTLRPIAKFQNDILLSIFSNYIEKYKNIFHKLGQNEKLNYIENSLKKDSKFKNLIRGIFIAHFTSEEYKFYSENISSANKRIVNLVKERLQSQMQYFESEHA